MDGTVGSRPLAGYLRRRGRLREVAVSVTSACWTACRRRSRRLSYRACRGDMALSMPVTTAAVRVLAGALPVAVAVPDERCGPLDDTMRLVVGDRSLESVAAAAARVARGAALDERGRFAVAGLG